MSTSLAALEAGGVFGRSMRALGRHPAYHAGCGCCLALVALLPSHPRRRWYGAESQKGCSLMHSCIFTPATLAEKHKSNNINTTKPKQYRYPRVGPGWEEETSLLARDLQLHYSQTWTPIGRNCACVVLISSTHVSSRPGHLQY